MTVIAWDGKTLAADRKCSGSRTSTTTKIFAHEGWRLAVCGNLSTAMALVAWFMQGRDPEKFSWSGNEETMLVAVDPDGMVHCYTDEPVPFFMNAPFEAWGSGADIARAVMFMGNDATKAVEIACELDEGCGNGMDWM